MLLVVSFNTLSNKLFITSWSYGYIFLTISGKKKVGFSKFYQIICILYLRDPQQRAERTAF